MTHNNWHKRTFINYQKKPQILALPTCTVSRLTRHV